MVEAVLFDMFDTLVLIENFKVFYTPCLKRLHAFLVEKEINIIFEDFRRVYFEVRDELFSEIEKTLEEPHFNVRIARVLHQFGFEFDASDPVVVGATAAFTEELMRYVQLDAEAIEVLKMLRERYRLGLVSNFAIPECVHTLLEKFGLTEFFDTIVVSGAINKRKPSPEIFGKALETLGVDASRTVFVGDTVGLDIKGAKGVGMKAVLIERHSFEKTHDVEPDKTIKNLKELLNVLKDCP